MFDVYLIIHDISFCGISEKKEKELAFKEYESLETTNKNLKTQVTCFAVVEICKHNITFVCKESISIQVNQHYLPFADSQVNKH